MRTVVPLLRAAPTEGNVPCRTFQRSACSVGSCVKRAGSRRANGATAEAAIASRPFRSDSSAAWYSTRRAAAPSGTERIDAGTPGWVSTDRSEARSRSSSALAPESRSGTIAAQAACIVGKRRRPVYLTGRSGTVERTASAMKASVPSDPTRRFRKISTGVSKSRKALSE